MRTASRTTRLPFQIATLLGAYLLFLVQPLIAKQILPWFGGAPAVWSTCLVFFQVALVAGYAYAHVTRRLGTRRQIALHAILLVATAATLPIAASQAWKPVDAAAPVWRLLVLLTVAVGAPYTMLATTAPMLQDWYRRAVPGGRPHRLYALSNTGSLAALASYPIVVEPTLPLRSQSILWSSGFVAFVILCGWCAWETAPVSRPEAPAPSGTPQAFAASGLDRLLWVVLSACGAGLLLAVTNQLCQDVAVVPLLWVVPLALYLLTFIISFAGWYSRRWWIGAFVAGFAGTVYVLGHATTSPLILQAGALALVLVAGCMLCHGELVRVRPHAEHLTAFYVAIAVGGSLGGMFVALAAPWLFVTYAELPLLLLAIPGLLLLAWYRDLTVQGKATAPAWLVVVPLAAFCVAGAVVLRHGATPPQTIAAVRDFYGRLTVVDDDLSNERPLRGLFHGRVLHGAQFRDAALRGTPTTYYAQGSGIEVALHQHSARLEGRPLAVGVVGLGAGTIAAWGEPGDRFRFFELDPVVVELARRYFTFLADSLATVDVVTGDARLSLEREMHVDARRHAYDVLAVDAFAGDSIPVHLLTRECFALYREALRTDGVLAFHVSNQYLDLRRVVRGLAGEAGLQTLEVRRTAAKETGAWASVWMLVSADEGFLRRAGSLAQPPERPTGPPVVWTDSFSSVLSVLRDRNQQ